ncbi:MAG: amidohydrolase family protein [Candidatus Eisenbacteria sp.]|nr:amidohydrolase family protein [Candidatus Eisenbacteria bacterium]
MLRDFTLRGVILQDFYRRDCGLFDLTFRQGRIAHFQHLPDGAQRNLYLTPGFQDAHNHLLHLGLARKRCDLSACTSLDEALQLLVEYRVHNQGLQSVLWAVNWDESGWSDRKAPTRAEIDHVVPDLPVVMRRVCGHRAVLNSRALEKASDHWDDLDPDGILTERQSMELSALWPPTQEELKAALLAAQDVAIAKGITRVSEMGSYGALDCYLAVAEKGLLKLDVNLYLPPDQLDRVQVLCRQDACSGSGLRVGGIKIFADGSVGARSAALRTPYADASHKGTLLYTDKALCELFERCLAADVCVSVHAIGDAAIDQILRQLEHLAAAGNGLGPGRVTIEHAEMIDDAMLERAQKLGVHLSLQPNFVARWQQPGGLYETALGSQRCRRMNPLRSVWDLEIPMVFGSDGMPMDPALGLHGAVSHPAEEERLTAQEALSVYLGARSRPAGSYWELEDWWVPGRADGVLYREDPLELTGGDLSRALVQGVLWRGQWVLEPPAELFRVGVVHAR